MAKKDKEKQIPEKDVKEPEVKEPEKAEQAPPAEDAAPEAAPEAPVKKDPWEEKYNQEHDAHLRLAEPINSDISSLDISSYRALKPFL